MITFSYSDIVEMVEKLDETAKLITTLEDIDIAAALDNIYDMKTTLATNVQGFEDMLDGMSDEYN